MVEADPTWDHSRGLKPYGRCSLEVLRELRITHDVVEAGPEVKKNRDADVLGSVGPAMGTPASVVGQLPRLEGAH